MKTNILIIDVESTAWETKSPANISEIIEIGYAILDRNGEIISNEGILVKPIKSTVSEFCTKLTTLTQKQVDAGVSFEEACDYLVRNLKSKDMTWASYGQYDKNMFEKQCKSFDVEYPFADRHINVKNLFYHRMNLSREIGVDKAIKHIEYEFTGTHHRGKDDAYNIARVLDYLLND